MKFGSAAVLAMLAVLAGCAAKTPPLVSTSELTVTDMSVLPPPMLEDQAAQQRPYLIGPGDKLTITVFGIENLSGKVQADGGGRIAVPLAGTIEAAGKTPDQLARDIETALRQRYVRNPQVSVNLDETVSQVVTVDGEVREPGLYPVVGNMTLLRAIATAKGVGEFAKLEDVVVFRTVGGKRMAALYNVAAIRRGLYADPLVYANDVVIVGDSPARRMFRNLIQLTPLLTTPIIIGLQNL